MADPRTGSASAEDEVRAVVRRIVDAVYEPAPSVSAVAGQPTGDTGRRDRAGEPGRVAVAIGADHGGYALKERIGRALAEQGHDVHDCGTSGEDAVDYPDFALAVATLVADGTCGAGIVVDGAGIGSCMAANKVPGVRAAMCYDLSTARNSREHNHANVLTLGARLIGPGLALDIVETWLATAWGPGRHAARVDKITAIEDRYLRAAPGVGTR
jgi:ribose 5-phosphate isomerase B